MTAVHSYMKISGHPVLHPDALSAEARRLGVSDAKWRGKANSVTISSGMEPASSYVVVPAAVMAQLDVNGPHTLELYCEPRDGSTAPVDPFDFYDNITQKGAIPFFAGNDLTPDQQYEGLDRFMLTSMYIYRAEAVLAGWTDVAGPYVLELRDSRQIYNMSGVDKAYNMMAPVESAYWTDSLDQGFPWTWQGMVTDLLNSVPLVTSVDVGSESAFPSAIPENYSFRGHSAWGAIGKILEDTGQIMFPRMPFYPAPLNDLPPTLGQASQQPTWLIGRASYVHEPNVDRRADYTDRCYCPSITASRAPTSYRVCFPDRQYTYQASADPEIYDSYDAMIETPVHSITVGTGGGLAGTQIVLHDSMPVLRNPESGAITNAALLNQRATEIANQYQAHLLGADKDDVFSGLHQFVPDGDIHSVTWFDFGQGWQTRVVHHPRCVDFDYPHRTYPDIAEPHIPVHRKIYGRVTSTNTIAPGKVGNAVLLYINTAGNWAEPGTPKSFSFRNVGLEDITGGGTGDDAVYIYAEWWWQKKEWVAWCGFRKPTP